MEQPGETRYVAYMLRMWRAEGDGAAWRASLEKVSDGERRNFASIAQLCAYLQSLVSAPQNDLPAKDRE